MSSRSRSCSTYSSRSRREASRSCWCWRGCRRCSRSSSTRGPTPSGCSASIDAGQARATRRAAKRSCKPIEVADCPIRLQRRLGRDDQLRVGRLSVLHPVHLPRGLRRVHPVRHDAGRAPMPVPIDAIQRKLDADFFAGRWARITDRQRELLWAIAHLDNADEEFTIQELVEKSKETARRSPSRPATRIRCSRRLAERRDDLQEPRRQVLLRRAAARPLHPAA